ncbi:MAG TPA: ABC transporter substrate-binding protein [Vineibacter sp.]|nr:ABC transporter substrate-binding protein [Vineibacter sp.]
MSVLGKKAAAWMAGLVGVGLLCSVAQAQTTLRVVAHSDLKVLDPIWTTAYITRNHGYMIYDTLLAQDGNLHIRPQMADWKVSDDKLTYTFTLRDGLEWHDGQPVTSEDVVPSIKRWAERDGMGQQMWQFVKELKAVDPKTVQLVLKEPYGLVLEALGKPSSTVPFIMPKRIAETPSNQQIKEMIGSGPFIFKQDEWKPGDKVVYVKNSKYKPRAEPPSGLAGGKVVKIDRVEWISIPDPLTAVNALIAGEIDMIELPPPDLFPVMKDEKAIQIYGWNVLGSQIIARFNHLHPPFNNVKARLAVLYATAQEDYLQAQVGDKDIYAVCNAPLVCGTPQAKTYGDLLIKPDLAKARQLLKESGYDGTPVVIMHATDLQSTNRLPQVAKAQLEKVGFKVDMQSMDWQSVVSRRAKKDPPAQGGWHMFFTTAVSVDAANPVNIFTSGGCDTAWFGWTCDEELEKARTAYSRATDDATRKALSDKIQDRITEQGHHLVIGQFKQFGAYRKDRMEGWLPGPVAVFWNISKK